MTEMTHVRAVTRSGAVEVTAPPDVLAEIAGLVRPFIDLVPADVHRPELPSVLVRPEPPQGSDWRQVTISSAYEPDRVLWVDDRHRAVAVVGGASAWRVQQVLRSVRHLLRWQAYAAGDLLLHGGLVTLGGRGVAFVGGKRSGKTSSILSALLRGGADFVSNDDLAVVEAVGGGLTGYGSPRTVNVRTDSLLALAGAYPPLAGLLSGTSHPTNAFEGRHRTAEAHRAASGPTLPGSLWVRATELAQVAGCALHADGPVDAVVFPGFQDSDAGPVLTRLDSDSAAATLTEHIETQGTKYDPFLADWFPTTDAVRRQWLVDRLVGELPCYRLTQDMRRLGDSTDLLLAELGARPV